MKSSRLFGFALLASLHVNSQVLFQQDGTAFTYPVNVIPGLAAGVVFSGLTTPRGIVFDAQRNFLLVVERGIGVTAFSPATGGWNRRVILKNPNITHGIQVDGLSIYVSTATQVLLYTYDSSGVSVTPTSPSVLIANIPSDETSTHTLEIERDSSGVAAALLVASGSGINLDVNARDYSKGISQIRRAPFNLANPAASQDYSNLEIIAYGFHNPSGLAFNPIPYPPVPPVNSKTVYVTDDAPDIGILPAFTAAFANDNPADELNAVQYLTGGTITPAPQPYGYPDCATLWNPNADPVGESQYTAMNTGDQFLLGVGPPYPPFTQDYCNLTSNNVQPVLEFQAHSTPLDITFYNSGSSPAPPALPSTLNGHAFVSMHGSDSRAPPVGFGVVDVPFPPQASTTTAPGYKYIIQAATIANCPSKCIRPVGVAFGGDGRLFVTSDTTGELFWVGQAVPIV